MALGGYAVLSVHGMILLHLLTSFLLPTITEPAVLIDIDILSGMLAPGASLLNFPKIKGAINRSQNH